jgi:hypothetical protein
VHQVTLQVLEAPVAVRAGLHQASELAQLARVTMAQHLMLEYMQVEVVVRVELAIQC